jgi:hypothetical protein
MRDAPRGMCAPWKAGAPCGSARSARAGARTRPAWAAARCTRARRRRRRRARRARSPGRAQRSPGRRARRHRAPRRPYWAAARRMCTSSPARSSSAPAWPARSCPSARGARARSGPLPFLDQTRMGAPKGTQSLIFPSNVAGPAHLSRGYAAHVHQTQRRCAAGVCKADEQASLGLAARPGMAAWHRSVAARQDSSLAACGAAHRQVEVGDAGRRVGIGSLLVRLPRVTPSCCSCEAAASA